MSSSISITQAINRIKKLNESFNYIGSSVLLMPVQEIESQMKERIFLKGLTPGGGKIGNYGAKWAEIRDAAGLQTEYIDLKFTGRLRESIKSTYLGDLFSSKSAVIYVSDDEVYEKKYGAWEAVFDLSQDEFVELYLYTEYYFNANIDKILTK